MKKFMLLILTIAICLTLGACGGEKKLSRDEVLAKCEKIDAEKLQDDVIMGRMDDYEGKYYTFNGYVESKYDDSVTIRVENSKLILWAYFPKEDLDKIEEKTKINAAGKFAKLDEGMKGYVGDLKNPVYLDNISIHTGTIDDLGKEKFSLYQVKLQLGRYTYAEFGGGLVAKYGESRFFEKGHFEVGDQLFFTGDEVNVKYVYKDGEETLVGIEHVAGSEVSTAEEVLEYYYGEGVKAEAAGNLNEAMACYFIVGEYKDACERNQAIMKNLFSQPGNENIAKMQGMWHTGDDNRPLCAYIEIQGTAVVQRQHKSEEAFNYLKVQRCTVENGMLVHVPEEGNLTKITYEFKDGKIVETGYNKDGNVATSVYSATTVVRDTD